jgi:hypothetical protein
MHGKSKAFIGTYMLRILVSSCLLSLRFACCSTRTGMKNMFPPHSKQQLNYEVFGEVSTKILPETSVRLQQL